jgi:hypothetical protein
MIEFRISFSCILIFGSQLLCGQIENTNDSIIYEASLTNAMNRGLKIQKSINIGIEYNELPYTIRNDHQFFLSESELNGGVTYNNIAYKNIGIQYDLVKDEVLTKNFNGRRIILVKEKVGDFNIEGHVFRKLTFNTSDLKMRSGYYEFLVDDEDVKLLAKRRKLIKGVLANQLSYRKEELRMEYEVKYFLEKKGVFYQVKNHKSIAKILMIDRKLKKELPKTISQEDRMIDIVNYYASLKNEN